ncbi:hypothetical protein RMATCC62417_00102 [Rhizopus microsporus]|nr:hypothetical protein RMATCC62417_00102 [Rhizopus microsporus]
MEKSNHPKAEYIAVPTEEVTVYEEQPKRCNAKRFIVFFLKGLLGALVLLTLVIPGIDRLSQRMFGSETEHFEIIPYDSFNPNVPELREPCFLRHNDNYAELNEFMDELHQTMGPLPSPSSGPHHHHRHHRHGKHHPAPPGDERLDFDDASTDILQLSKDKDKKEKHHWKPFCKLHKLEAESTVFAFKTDDYKKAKFFLNGHFNRGGHVRVSKSKDASVDFVKVNVTIYAGRSELRSEAQISAFEHEGDYVVQLERDPKHPPPPFPFPPPHHHHRHHKPKQEDCLVYSVDIEFPQNTEYYEELQFHVKQTQRIEGGHGIEEISFGTIKAGLGRGAIIFDGLKAKTIKLGVLRGVVMGNYQPEEKFLAGSVHGATKVKLEPTGEHFNVTAASTFGPASVDLPADSFSGDFGLFHFFGPAPTIEAPNPEDIHVTKLKHGVKAGYYKEEHTGSRVIISAKFHGAPALYLN